MVPRSTTLLHEAAGRVRLRTPEQLDLMQNIQTESNLNVSQCESQYIVDICRLIQSDFITSIDRGKPWMGTLQKNLRSPTAKMCPAVSLAVLN
jgi:hypothetical protein